MGPFRMRNVGWKGCLDDCCVSDVNTQHCMYTESNDQRRKVAYVSPIPDGS